MKKILKKHSFKRSLLTLVLLGTPVIATTMIAMNLTNSSRFYSSQSSQTQKVEKLLFDGKTFDSIEEVIEDALDKVEIVSVSGMGKNYLFDRQVFTNYIDFENYLKNKFAIENKIVYSDPNEYLVNSSRELSNYVLDSRAGIFQKVYQGKDDVAYKTRLDALNTYKVYDSVYKDTSNKIYSNKEDFVDYLKVEQRKKIIDQENKQLELYQNGALWQTEKEVKAWLRKNIITGFTYGGANFSEYNYKSFLNFFNSLSDLQKKQLIDRNIKPIKNADKGSYWLDLEKAEKMHPGTFSGPQYIETSTNLDTIINGGFNEISSVGSGGFIQGMIGIAFASSLKIANFTSDVKGFDWTKKLDPKADESNILLEYLKFLAPSEKDKNKKATISKELFDTLKNLLSTGNNATNFTFKEDIIKSSTLNFNKISSKEFTDLHKVFVAMKRILSTIKIYAEFSKEEISKFENTFRKLAWELLTYDLTSDKNDKSKTYDAYDFLNNFQGFDFYQLCDFILNPNKFYKDSNDHDQLIGLLNTMNQVVVVFENFLATTESFGDIKKARKDYRESIDNKKKNSIIAKDAENKKDAVNKVVNETLKENLGSVGRELGMGNKFIEENNGSKTQFLAAFTAVTKIFGSLLEINSLLDVVSFKTLEYKIDDYQSIYYYVQVPKIFGYEFPVKQPSLEVIKLNESILDIMLPTKDREERDTKVYEFQGKYYLERENAFEDLLNTIYLTPQYFLTTNQVLVSNLDFDDNYYLPKPISRVSESSDGTEKTITSVEYQKSIAEEIDNYVDILFSKHFQNSKKTNLYLDGFGDVFDNLIEAENSFNRKINDKAELEKWKYYSYTTKNNKTVVYKTIVELDNFVNENEVISEKYVNGHDLIKSANFNQLKEFNGAYFDIYELNYYGDKKYFLSRKDAWNYLLKNLNNFGLYKERETMFYNENYIFRDEPVGNYDSFIQWVKDNTIKIEESIRG